MAKVIVETRINAPAEVCFDLMRDVRIHTETTLYINERAVAGVINGKVSLGQTITFEGRHFGLRQRLIVKVVECERPHRFVDAMISGAFRSFVHVHEFAENDDVTQITDTIMWESPLGFIGKIFDALLLKRHLERLVTRRNEMLRELAESSSLS
jgi:ligand-binding SRPBCC domain-containing protein